MEKSLSSICNWVPCPRSSSFLRPFHFFKGRSPALSPFSSSICCRHLHPSSSSSSPVDRTLSDIKNSGIIACLRAESSQLAIEAARAAISGGISVLEIVMSTPDVFEILQQLVQEYPTITFGVGTVLNDKDAKKALLSGAKFLMSPAIVKEIMSVVHAGEALYIPGVMTPTEILSAYNMGAKIVKVYPVSALGGVQYIAAIRKPFSHIPMVASQGVTIDLLGDYILQGASAVLLSDAIFSKEAMGRKDFNAIYRLAQLAVFEGKKALERKRNELP
ncbi:KHG/KDPG aldolase-like isoform X1 [Impatiens glandulifera]|uniref:KHG/KDPG aldolase-like isoform X1 n=1 Tax=Impatiens glandulifera TaxID=253017 RepID=UPI001FB1183D|nr:KHG/KDPG aldolase-like isoform X1 [Impatiens glandulifera]